MKSPDLQADVIAFLSDPATHGLAWGEVRRIDTHAAIVFLAGDDAFKIKRAVRLPFLDFTTLEQRRLACAREIDINRPNAPALYRAAVAITRQADGALALDGPGDPVEWAVRMRRFDETATLDRLADDGRLASEIIDRLAEQVIAMHARAPVTASAPSDAAAAADQIGAVALQSCAEIAGFADLFPADQAETFTGLTQAALARGHDLIADRAPAGAIRRCHGDLHLGNVALIEGAPVIFDALEFDEALATIDVLYDLAFLLMDLWERGFKAAANRVLNRWLIAQPEPDSISGLALLPLFLSMRAAIRAKVQAERLRFLSGQQKAEAARQAQAMFALALEFLKPPAARLVAIGGLSGTGKTTVAIAIAPEIGPPPGAVVLRSDVIRKQLAGVAETVALPQSAYTPEASKQVYDHMLEQAAMALAAGHGAVLDAVNARPDERAAARAAADAAGAPFDGIWLAAEPARLIERVEQRTGDASDATGAVVKTQLSYETGPINWDIIDAGADRETVIERVRSRLDPDGGAETTLPDRHSSAT